MKIEIIHSDTPHDLQSMVNRFIEEEGINDIQSISYTINESDGEHYAMMLYSEVTE